MKTNEARPFFRVLALLIAIPAWSVAGILGYHTFKESSLDHIDWRLLGATIAAGLAFSYVAITGYMPKFLVPLFSWGSINDDKNYK